MRLAVVAAVALAALSQAAPPLASLLDYERTHATGVFLDVSTLDNDAVPTRCVCRRFAKTARRGSRRS